MRGRSHQAHRKGVYRRSSSRFSLFINIDHSVCAFQTSRRPLGDILNHDLSSLRAPSPSAAPPVVPRYLPISHSNTPRRRPRIFQAKGTCTTRLNLYCTSLSHMSTATAIIKHVLLSKRLAAERSRQQREQQEHEALNRDAQERERRGREQREHEDRERETCSRTRI